MGYNRDLQLLKDIIFPATTELAECLDMATFMLGHMQVRRDIVSDPRYDYLFTVEEVNGGSGWLCCMPPRAAACRRPGTRHMRRTTSRTRELDLRLARYDVQGSMAHIRMLESIGLLSKDELDKLLAGLQEIAAIIEEGNLSRWVPL